MSACSNLALHDSHTRSNEEIIVEHLLSPAIVAPDVVIVAPGCATELTGTSNSIAMRTPVAGHDKTFSAPTSISGKIAEQRNKVGV